MWLVGTWVRSEREGGRKEGRWRRHTSTHTHTVEQTHVTHTHRGSKEANTDIKIHEHTHTIHKNICRTVEQR